MGLLARQTEMLAQAGQRRVLEWLPACLLAHLVAVEHGDALGVASIGRAEAALDFVQVALDEAKVECDIVV